MRRALLAAFIAFSLPAGARQPAPAPAVPGPALTYVDLVELSLASPVVLRATVAEADRLRERDAPDVPTGQVRLLVTAQVTAALRAPDLVPASVGYLWQTAVDPRGRPPRIEGAPVLLFAGPVPDRADQLRLVNAAGQVPWTEATEATVRAILTEARDPVLASLRVTGIDNAFHVAGTVPGEGESQFFLATADSRPISLVVLSRPGQARSLRVATGEVIDDAAQPVKHDTLLWYRLACALPAVLPAEAGQSGNPDDDGALAADYTFVRETLGSCTRAIG